MYQGEQSNQGVMQQDCQGVPQGGNDYYQQQYQQPYQQGPELEEPVSLGEWMIALLLTCIPCVNIVLMFVWAFSKTEKKSKSNYFKAALIWSGIMFGIMLIFWVLIGVTAMTAIGSMQ